MPCDKLIGNQSVVESLTQLLADSVIVCLKIRLYWWTSGSIQQDNLTSILSSEYQLLESMCDQIAQTLFSIGAHSPTSYQRLYEISEITDCDPGVNTSQMLRQLSQDHQQLIQSIQRIEKYLSNESIEHIVILGLLRSITMNHEACVEGLDSEAVRHSD